MWRRPTSPRRGSIWAALFAGLVLRTAGALQPAVTSEDIQGGAGLQPASISAIFQRTKAWDDYAQPVSVLRLGQAASALHFVPGARDAAPPRFLAVGDAGGGLHLLHPATGQLLAQAHTGAPSPVTALGSYRLTANTTVLLTGHADGGLRLHALTQRQQQRGEEGEEALPPSLALLQAFPPLLLLCGEQAATEAGCSAADGRQRGACPAAAAGCPAILGVHGSSRGGRAASAALVLDASGRLAVLHHGGPGGDAGEAKLVHRTAADQPLLAVRLSGGSATLLAAGGVAGLRLGPPPRPRGGDRQQQQQQDGGLGRPLAFKPCSGLNGSRLVAAAFDGQQAGRAYALTSDGLLLSLSVGGEKGSPGGCRVRGAAASLLKAQQARQAGGDGVALTAAAPGYLLATAAVPLDALLLLNVTGAPRRPPRLLLSTPLPALRRQFSLPASAAEAGDACGGSAAPLLAASRAGQVAVALGGTVLALYETALPYRPPPTPPLASMAWLQVVQPLAMALVAGMVVYRARQRRSGGGAGGGGFAGDPRLREFERLLRDAGPLGGGGRNTRAANGGGGEFFGGGGNSGSGSDVEDSSHLGRLPRARDSAAAQPQPRRRLLGRGGGPGAAGRSRAFTMAAADDRETLADGPFAPSQLNPLLDPLLFPSDGSGGGEDEDEEEAGEVRAAAAAAAATRRGGALGGAFGSDIDMRSSLDRRSADGGVSELRHRLGQAHL